MSISDPGKRRVRAAGKTLVNPNASPVDREAAIEIINNWRARHIPPMGILSTDLRLKCSQIPLAFAVERLKRLESIEAKLLSGRVENLWTMQDIGGCRAVLPTVDDVRAIDALYRNGPFLPKRRDDYIAQPKESGYRGIHCIVKYQGDTTAEYDGMLIEIQLRSHLQHIWATAVETVGHFTKFPLKASVGPDYWLRFFTLMSAEIAFMENCPQVPGTPATRAELIAELRPLALDARVQLFSYATLVQHSRTFRSHHKSDYYLLTMATPDSGAGFGGYSRKELEQANRDYADAEARGLNAVLVSTDSLSNLYNGYPNYFLDINTFNRLVFKVSQWGIVQ